ncbi:uncharacterized protein LOC131072962 [Cryptomeria japonica]|uniref:uncharacterized protein LOC131072962 n=1 Tax=Cryptomeria japonica TaxID=3369 RepID=UPI0027DA504B|nr:uncharacterized protein LOC131072962 [Cryptomeria japonica]
MASQMKDTTFLAAEKSPEKGEASSTMLEITHATPLSLIHPAPTISNEPTTELNPPFVAQTPLSAESNQPSQEESLNPKRKRAPKGAAIVIFDDEPARRSELGKRGAGGGWEQICRGRCSGSSRRWGARAGGGWGSQRPAGGRVGGKEDVGGRGAGGRRGPGKNGRRQGAVELYGPANMARAPWYPAYRGFVGTAGYWTDRPVGPVSLASAAPLAPTGLLVFPWLLAGPRLSGPRQRFPGPGPHSASPAARRSASPPSPAAPAASGPLSLAAPVAPTGLASACAPDPHVAPPRSPAAARSSASLTGRRLQHSPARRPPPAALPRHGPPPQRPSPGLASSATLAPPPSHHRSSARPPPVRHPLATGPPKSH